MRSTVKYFLENLRICHSAFALAAMVIGAFVCPASGAQSSFPAPFAPRNVSRVGFASVPPDRTSVIEADSLATPLAPITASWEGMSSDFTLEPPDPHGAAGPNGILQVINVRLAYWDKQGHAIWGPTALDGFFAGVGNNAFSFDPRALYDRQSGRFYVVLLEQDESNQQSYINLAVSKTSNPLTKTASDWYFYRINNSRSVANTRYWGDYPGLGFDAQAIYVTVNLYSFNNNNGDSQIAVLNKSAFLNGTTNYAFVYTTGGVESGFTLQPCTVTGGNSPTNVAYFAETPISATAATAVRIWALQNPLSTRTLTSVSVSVPNTGGIPPFSGAPQPGTSITIDTLDGRTQGNAFWYNGAVWFCTTAGGSLGKSIVHYYKINLNNYPAGTPSLGEAGFIDGGPGEWTYQPSIGANSRGDVGIVYCQSSASRNPTIFAAIHAAGATSFDTPVLVKASPGFYNGGRWGDYASVTADPVDESFWVTHEWAKTKQGGAWSTWWAQLSAPPVASDGIMEITITPPSGSTLLAGTTERVSVQVTDALPVTNATVVATVNGTNLVFSDTGIAPDLSANDAIYTANLAVPNSTNFLTLSFIITASGKTNSTNVVTYAVVPFPVNDFFTNATKVPPGGALYLANNRFATMETGEPAHAGITAAAGSLWWSWSPTSTTNVFLDTTGSGVDTVLAVYQGTSVGSLTQVIATNDVGTKKQAYLNFNATGGASYRIAVASVNTNATGSIRLLVAPGGTVDTQPPTVGITSPLSGQWTSNFLVTVTGTASDPPPNASGLNRVLVSVNGELPLTAIGTTNWTRTFGLDQGINHISVTAEDVAGNVSSPATIDVTYVIMNPVNDLFASAIPLPGDSGTVSAITTNATKEFNEPDHAGNLGGKSVWYSYTPVSDGLLALSTSNSTFDTLLAVYTGSSVSALTVQAFNDDWGTNGFSSLSVAVRSNQTYSIAIDGFDSASGMANLTYSFTLGSVFNFTVGADSGGHVSPSFGSVVSNTTVVITATPDPFFEFDSWSGDFSSTVNPLSLVVNSNISLIAHFHKVSFTDDFETGNLLKLNWATGGNVPWSVQTNTVLAGSFAAKSGAIANRQTSSLLITTNFAGGTVSFFYKISSEPQFDYFTFYVDGIEQLRGSGEVDWTSFSLSLAAGTHTLEWRYTKDQNGTGGQDAAFIDNVNLPLRVPVDATTPAHLDMVRQSDGTLLLRITGQTNQQYVIQGATNLTIPIIWQNLSTNIANGGTIQFTDPATSSNPIRFYRAVVP